MLARGQTPSFRTICRFREEHLDDFKRLFVQLAQESDMVKMGTIAIDSSKVQANASKHKAMSYERMLTEENRLHEEIAKLTRSAKKQDDIDDDSFGPDFRGYELPTELSRRESRLATIQAAKNRLEERRAAESEAKREAESKGDEARTEEASQRVLRKPRDQMNFTDPESRIMTAGGKSFEQAYNAQVAVDAKQ